VYAAMSDWSKKRPSYAKSGSSFIQRASTNVARKVLPKSSRARQMDPFVVIETPKDAEAR